MNAPLKVLWYKTHSDFVFLVAEDKETMSYQGPPPPTNNSHNPTTNSSVGNMRHGHPPPPGGLMKTGGFVQPMFAPPGANGPSSMAPPTNGKAAPPNFGAGIPPQRPYFSGPGPQNSQPNIGQQMPGPAQFPPRATNPHQMNVPRSGPLPRGPVPVSQINQNFGGPPPSNSSPNLHQGGRNSQPPLSMRPPGGPYGLSNQGPVGPPPPAGVNSNLVGSSPGGQQRLSGPPPPGPAITLTSGSLPGGRLPPPVGVQPPTSASHMGQGGGDFHAGSSGNFLFLSPLQPHFHTYDER